MKDNSRGGAVQKRFLAFVKLTASLLVVLFLVSCVPDVVKYNTEGNMSFEEGDYVGALEAYRLAQVSEPDQSEPYYNAANTYNRQGDVTGTELQSEQALKSPDTELSAKTWYNLGNVYFDAQQWQKAIEAYKSALRVNPEDQDAKYNLELANRAKQNQESQDSAAEEDQQRESKEQQQDQGQADSQDESPEKETSTEEEQKDSSDAGQEVEQEQQQMTSEEAQQLLEALLGDSETLQEHLQQYFRAPGGAPEQDW